MTRKEYLQNPSQNHENYYRQFVTSGITALVVRMIGEQRLLDSEDPHLNDISLKTWDFTAMSLPLPEINRKMRECGDFPTQAGLVCICKTAARDWMEEQRHTV